MCVSEKKSRNWNLCSGARTGVDLKNVFSRVPARFLKVWRAITEAALAFANLHAAMAPLEALADKVAAYCADEMRQTERTINN